MPFWKRKWTELKAWWQRRPTPATAPRVPRRDAGAALYASDQPVSSAMQDRFARASFAQRIADTIATRDDDACLVLGLYGPWGDGKTSVLRMIEERLKGYDNRIVVRFNPWHFTSESQLLRGFFDTLATAIGTRLSTRTEDIGALLSNYGSLLSVVNAGEAAKGVGESLSTVDLDALKARVEGLLADDDKHVVVLIDDIDRLDRAETHLIFKLVKLSAGFERTTYLLAFDDAVVASALGERYGAGGDAAGRAFLEKIIQVPLHLPAAEAISLRKLAFEGVDRALTHADIELTRQQVDIFSLQFTSGLDESLHTPRQAHLYANALLFALPMVKGEVNIVDFMLIEGLRIFHPRLHRALRENASLLLSVRERDNDQRAGAFAALVEAATPELTPALRTRLISGLLRHLFPRCDRMGYGPEWDSEWTRDQRVCASSYFHKFFAYGASTSEVSDRVVDTLIQALPTQSTQAQDAVLRTLATPEAAASLVRRLRQREDQVRADAASALALTVARNGELFPAERGPFALGGTRTQAAILVLGLLKGVADPVARLGLATDVLRQATPLPFASDCLRWLWPSDSEPEETWVFDKPTFDRLRAVVVERIERADASSPLYRQFGADAQYSYWWWHKQDAAGVVARVLEHLDRGPDEIDALLDAQVGESWGLESGMPSRSDLRRHDYDEIARLVAPAEVARRLRARYGAELDDPHFHHGADVPLPRRIAHQFMVVHQAVLAEVPPAAAPVAHEGEDAGG